MNSKTGAQPICILLVVLRHKIEVVLVLVLPTILGWYYYSAQPISILLVVLRHKIDIFYNLVIILRIPPPVD